VHSLQGTQLGILRKSELAQTARTATECEISKSPLFASFTGLTGGKQLASSSPPGFPARCVVERSCSCSVTREHGCAERVKVVVRVRPPFAHETGGAVSMAPEGKALALYRECAHCSQQALLRLPGVAVHQTTPLGVVTWLQTLLLLGLQQQTRSWCPECAWCNRRDKRAFGSWAQG